MAIRTLRRNRAWPMRLTGGSGKELAERRHRRARRDRRGRGASRSARERRIGLRLARSRRRICSTDRRQGNRRSHRRGCPSAARYWRGIWVLCSIVEIGKAFAGIELKRRRKGLVGQISRQREQEPQFSSCGGVRRQVQLSSGSRRGRARSRTGARPGRCACPASRCPPLRRAAFPSAARCRRRP